MDHIKFYRTLRRVERTAGQRGYRGDALAEQAPLVGTLAEQLEIATIGCDTSPGPMSTRDRALHNRLVRGAVLTHQAAIPTPKPQRRARAW